MKQDFTSECMDSIPAEFAKQGVSAMREVFCATCLNSECVNAKGYSSRWEGRMDRQTEALHNPSFADVTSPEFAPIHLQNFQTFEQDPEDWSVAGTRVSIPDSTVASESNRLLSSIAMLKGMRAPETLPEESSLESKIESAMQGFSERSVKFAKWMIANEAITWEALSQYLRFGQDEESTRDVSIQMWAYGCLSLPLSNYLKVVALRGSIGDVEDIRTDVMFRPDEVSEYALSTILDTVTQGECWLHKDGTMDSDIREFLTSMSLGSAWTLLKVVPDCTLTPEMLKRMLGEGYAIPVINLASGLKKLDWRDDYLLSINLDASEESFEVREGSFQHAAFSGLGPAPLRFLRRVAMLCEVSDSFRIEKFEIPEDILELLLGLNWIREVPNQNQYWMDPLLRHYVLSMTSNPDKRDLTAWAEQFLNAPPSNPPAPVSAPTPVVAPARVDVPTQAPVLTRPQAPAHVQAPPPARGNTEVPKGGYMLGPSTEAPKARKEILIATAEDPWAPKVDPQADGSGRVRAKKVVRASDGTVVKK